MNNLCVPNMPDTVPTQWDGSNETNPKKFHVFED